MSGPAGQVDLIEQSRIASDDCADVWMPLANVRCGINRLMAKEHIRRHILRSRQR